MVGNLWSAIGSPRGLGRVKAHADIRDAEGSRRNVYRPRRARQPGPHRGRRGPAPGADETKTRILDAALGEFSTHGVAGARVDRISATAGCNKNLLYVYFGSKENLFTAVLEQHLVRVYADIPFTPDDLPGFAGRVFDFAMTRPT